MAQEEVKVVEEAVEEGAELIAENPSIGQYVIYGVAGVGCIYLTYRAGKWIINKVKNKNGEKVYPEVLPLPEANNEETK